MRWGHLRQTIEQKIAPDVPRQAAEPVCAAMLSSKENEHLQLLLLWYQFISFLNRMNEFSHISMWTNSTHIWRYMMQMQVIEVHLV